MAEDVYSNPTKNRIENDETPESKYPYNNVWQFPGGVRLVVGDERGKECVKLFHPSGTYFEMFPDGKLAMTHVGEKKEYNKGGVTLTIDENSDVHISGHSKLTVGGGAHIEIAGDAGVMIGGKTSMISLGDMGLTVAGNLYMGVKGDFKQNVMGNMETLVQGTNRIGTGGTTTVQAPELQLNPVDGGNGYTA
jgi:hypothetical protein